MDASVDDEHWVREMVALSREVLEQPEPHKHKLSYNEKLIQDFIDGRGIFAEDPR